MVVILWEDKMTRLFHMVKISLIVSILILCNFFFLTDVTASAKMDDPLLSYISKRFDWRFDQYIEIDYDASLLNQTIDVDQSLNIPLTITYWTNIPDYLFWDMFFGNCTILQKFLEPIRGIFFAIINTWIFGEALPTQLLHVNIVEELPWANVRIATPNVSAEIMTNNFSKEFVTYPPKRNFFQFTSSLIISPLEEAPAQVYSIGLEVICKEKGMINEAVFREDITFTPTFIPKIQIEQERPVRIVSPLDAVNFKIAVTNTANKKVRVTPNLAIMDSKWNPAINPSFHDIVSGEQKDFFFSIYAPYDFGWYDDTKSFQMNFTAEAFPLSEGNEVGGPYQVTLTVNNHGFSTPGFEFLIMLLSLLVIIIWKNISKNNN